MGWVRVIGLRVSGTVTVAVFRDVSWRCEESLVDEALESRADGGVREQRAEPLGDARGRAVPLQRGAAGPVGRRDETRQRRGVPAELSLEIVDAGARARTAEIDHVDILLAGVLDGRRVEGVVGAVLPGVPPGGVAPDHPDAAEIQQEDAADDLALVLGTEDGTAVAQFRGEVEEKRLGELRAPESPHRLEVARVVLADAPGTNGQVRPGRGSETAPPLGRERLLADFLERASGVEADHLAGPDGAVARGVVAGEARPAGVFQHAGAEWPHVRGDRPENAAGVDALGDEREAVLAEGVDDRAPDCPRDGESGNRGDRFGAAGLGDEEVRGVVAKGGVDGGEPRPRVEDGGRRVVVDDGPPVVRVGAPDGPEFVLTRHGTRPARSAAFPTPSRPSPPVNAYVIPFDRWTDNHCRRSSRRDRRRSSDRIDATGGDQAVTIRGGRPVGVARRRGESERKQFDGCRSKVGMSPPTVSVVLPTYDRPDKLRRAVATVAAQTYDPVELVVVDDHSPEPARAVLDDCDTTGLATVTCIRHGENRGANAARNTGIREASGDCLAFLDDDDRWESEKLARQVDAMEAGGERVGVVYTGARYVYPDGERVIVNDVRGDATEAILRGESVAEFSALLVRASVVARAGLPDERFPSWQDHEWLLRLSLHCEFDVVPEPLTIRHWDHEGRIGQNFAKRRDVSFPLFVEKHRDLAREYGLEHRFVASLLETLVIDAAQNGHYGQARNLALRTIRTDPSFRTPWFYLLACLGGGLTYRPAKRLMALVQS